jgi:hypothetical protein
VSGALGVLVVAALAWLIYAGRVRVIASRRYNWSRKNVPDLDAFSKPAEPSVIGKPVDPTDTRSERHEV